jgi:molybdate transport system substrate-binding protein
MPDLFRRRSAALALAGLALGAGAPALAQPGAAPPVVLTVSAAASLAEAMRELGTRFEAANPGTTVRLNLAASGVLVQQLIQGAPVDVFASADEASMDRAVRAGVVDATTRRVFATNTLVIVVPADGSARIASVADLAGPAVRRIAIGKPETVPAGRYAGEALAAAGIAAAVQPRLVFADHVRQVLDYVARGEVDAGFVYRSDAAVMASRVRVAAPARGHAPITYPVAAVKDSRHAAPARRFVAFLGSGEAQAVLAKHGFGPP